MDNCTLKPHTVKKVYTQHICEIGEFYITETNVTFKEGNTKIYFNIRNSKGEIIGSDYHRIDVPIKILNFLDKLKSTQDRTKDSRYHTKNSQLGQFNVC